MKAVPGFGQAGAGRTATSSGGAIMNPDFVEMVAARSGHRTAGYCVLVWKAYPPTVRRSCVLKPLVARVVDFHDDDELKEMLWAAAYGFFIMFAY